MNGFAGRMKPGVVKRRPYLPLRQIGQRNPNPS